MEALVTSLQGYLGELDGIVYAYHSVGPSSAQFLAELTRPFSFDVSERSINADTLRVLNWALNMTERTRVRYARPQQSVSRRVGSSFTIKNILNLPDDPNDESTEPAIRHALVFDIATPSTQQLINVSPPPNARSHSILRSECRPCMPWTVRFTSQFISPRGVGITDFAMGPCLNMGDDNNGLKLCRRRPTRKKKQRPLFTPQQVQKMDKEFDSMKYLTEDKRAELAAELMLTETQVKTWFQNRRTRWRKELRNEDPPRNVPDGRLKHSSETWK